MAEAAMTSADTSPTSSDLAAVRQRVQTSGTSFYWAMRFASRAKSDALFAIYAFCREVDDIADGDIPGDKIAMLNDWRRRVDGLYAGRAEDSVTRALLSAIDRFGLKQTDFMAVIAGMEMDATGPIVAPDLATLDLYCDRVASAVGRLCTCVFGETGNAGMAVARHLGRALQLTNIIRDVMEDAGLGRLYLPAEILAAHGVLVTTPPDVIRHPHIGRVIADVGAMAAKEFAAAEAALAQCDARAMRPARVMMRVYARTLDRIRADGWRVRPRAAGFARLVERVEKLALALYYGLV